MKLISWNVNGLRAVYKKGFEEFVAAESPDILCLQEIKIDQEKLEKEVPMLPGYSRYCSHAEKKGYSGVATYIKDGISHQEKGLRYGIDLEHFDSEGRFIVTDHTDFLLYNIYFPSGTTGDVRQDFKYEFLDAVLEHVNELPPEKRKKLIICGDYNICHRAIDIHHPKKAEQQQMSGFLPEERAWMDRFSKAGFIDSYRHSQGDIPDKYTWWSFRAGSRGKNLGWRIDYFFVAENLSGKIQTADILSEQLGSDHCPIILDLDI